MASGGVVGWRSRGVLHEWLANFVERRRRRLAFNNINMQKNKINTAAQDGGGARVSRRQSILLARNERQWNNVWNEASNFHSHSHSGKLDLASSIRHMRRPRPAVVYVM